MRISTFFGPRRLSLLGAVLGCGALISLSGCGGGSSGSTGGGGGLSSSTLVFVSTRDGNPEIYSMRSDGTAIVRLTNNAAADSTPSRRRDGTRIVFSSMRDGNAEIYTMGPGGETDNLVRLTADSGASAPADTNPIFSPDGTRILWTSTRGGRAAFWMMNADGSNQNEVSGALAAGILNASWHPNNVRLLGTRNTGGTSAALVNFTPGDTYTNIAVVTSPSHPRYSPDGTKIALTQGAAGTNSVVSYYQANGTLTGNLPVTAAGVDATEPSWSSNSQQIVWTSGATGARQLYIITPGQPAATQLTTGAGENFSASWGD